MKQTDIYFGKEAVGSAAYWVEGLYYRISCKCRDMGHGLYRIKAVGETGEVDLGICIPQKGNLVLEKRVAIKKLGWGQLSFGLQCSEQGDARSFVLVDGSAPFCNFAELEQACLHIRNGQTGLLIEQKPVSDQFQR